MCPTRVQMRRGASSGCRVNCEHVPLLPARVVAWMLDDTRKIPYLLIWKSRSMRTLPRNRGRVRLLICPYCSIPRRGLYGWEPGGRFTDSVVRSTWGCRKCNLLRYASEGGALLIRPRGTLGLVFGTGHSPRPESWLPYVFESTALPVTPSSSCSKAVTAHTCALGL
jgi:hypothetical protein